MSNRAGEEVKLLGLWASPYVLRARIALNIKGVDYKFLEETFGKKSDLLIESNPVYKKMPVLIHQGKTILESMIIVQYIDDVWNNNGKPSIVPTDPYELAMARFWAVYIDDKWTSSVIGMMRATTKEAKVAAIEQAAVALQTLENVFEKHYKGKPFFGGESIGYLDIALGSSVGWIGVLEKISGVTLLDEAKTPQLVGWVARFWSHDAVKSVIPETDRFVEFSEEVFAVRAAQATK